jgi:hypothetical protein
MSEISLDGQIFIDLKIDGKDIPVGLPNFLTELAIIENVAGVPVLSMTINDSEGYISENIPFTDSNKFSIIIASDKSELKENKSLDFRLFNWSAVQYQKGFTYKINAMFDNHSYITEVISKAYSGSSDYVISEIAKACKLDYVGTDSCVDSQNWLNFSDTLSTFAKKIAQHSFIQNGCMALCLCANGDLIYKDMIKAINGEPDGYFDNSNTEQKAGVHTLQEYAPSSSAGFMNAWLNYGYVTVEDLLSGMNTSYDAVTLTSTSGGAAAINEDISNSIKSVRKDYVIQDCGNTHPKYWKTFHNNIRILSLFSQKMIILVDRVTNLVPLDVVDLNIINISSNKPTLFSGKYLIGAKKTLVKGTKYAEIFELYRNTMPKRGEAPLSNSGPPGGVQNITTEKNPPRKTQKVTMITTGPVEVATTANANTVIPK